MGLASNGKIYGQTPPCRPPGFHRKQQISKGLKVFWGKLGEGHAMPDTTFIRLRSCPDHPSLPLDASTIRLEADMKKLRWIEVLSKLYTGPSSTQVTSPPRPDPGRCGIACPVQ